MSERADGCPTCGAINKSYKHCEDSWHQIDPVKPPRISSPAEQPTDPRPDPTERIAWANVGKKFSDGQLLFEACDEEAAAWICGLLQKTDEQPACPVSPQESYGFGLKT